MEHSAAVLSVLEAAGWTPDRQVDVGRVVGVLAEKGLALSAQAIRFFAAFAGLTVSVSSSTPHNPRRTSELCFNPSEAATAC